jgi:cholesterol transport system auxiliary component
MTRSPPLARLAVALAAAFALSGCISLLPKSKPAHLYRFGQIESEAAAPASAAPSGQIGVFRAHSRFQREAAGDRLLTVTNGQVAYIADTRWVAPASVLWDEAVLRAFDADPGAVRLILRGEQAPAAAYILRLDVRNFEARYEHGPKAPPTILVRVRGTITRAGDQKLMSEQIFEKTTTAADNRVSAIGAAFDEGVDATLAGIVACTDAAAKPL